MSSGNLCKKMKKIQVLILFFFIYNFAYTQNNQSLSLEFSLQPIQKLIFENSKSFPPINIHDYEREYLEIKDAVTLSISSNVPWKVVVFTNQINLYKSYRKFKSVNNFKWRSSFKPFQSISNTPKVILRGKAGVKDFKIELDYLIKLNWKNTPPGRWEFQPVFKLVRDYEKFIRLEPKFEKIKKFPDKKRTFNKRP